MLNNQKQPGDSCLQTVKRGYRALLLARYLAVDMTRGNHTQISKPQV